MNMEMRKPSPKGKWEKVLDSSRFWLLPVAVGAAVSLQKTLGFWLSLLVVASVMLGTTFFLRIPATAERNRRLEEDAKSGVIECAVRYPGAWPGSLGAGWSSGFAEISDGTMKFQAAFDMAVQRKGSVTVFRDLHLMGDRVLSDKRMLASRRVNHVIAVRTDKGEIELAATRKSLKSFEEYLRHGGSGSVRS